MGLTYGDGPRFSPHNTHYNTENFGKINLKSVLNTICFVKNICSAPGKAAVDNCKC